jgi:hypothetical protein
LWLRASHAVIGVNRAGGARNEARAAGRVVRPRARSSEDSMKYLSIVAILLCLPAAASAMPTAAFIARWHAAASVAKTAGRTPDQIAQSPELKTLFAEFSEAAQRYRRAVVSARAAGTPRACPPSDVNLSVDGVLADIERLPAPWKTRDFADSFAAAMDRRYPCTTHAPA